jgi:hypothetical protein
MGGASISSHAPDSCAPTGSPAGGRRAINGIKIYVIDLRSCFHADSGRNPGSPNSRRGPERINSLDGSISKRCTPCDRCDAPHGLALNLNGGHRASPRVSPRHQARLRMNPPPDHPTGTQRHHGARIAPEVEPLCEGLPLEKVPDTFSPPWGLTLRLCREPAPRAPARAARPAAWPSAEPVRPARPVRRAQIR